MQNHLLTLNFKTAHVSDSDAKSSRAQHPHTDHDDAAAATLLTLYTAVVEHHTSVALKLTCGLVFFFFFFAALRLLFPALDDTTGCNMPADTQEDTTELRPRESTYVNGNTQGLAGPTAWNWPPKQNASAPCAALRVGDGVGLLGPEVPFTLPAAPA